MLLLVQAVFLCTLYMYNLHTVGIKRQEAQRAFVQSRSIESIVQPALSDDKDSVPPMANRYTEEDFGKAADCIFTGYPATEACYFAIRAGLISEADVYQPSPVVSEGNSTTTDVTSKDLASAELKEEDTERVLSVWYPNEANGQPWLITRLLAPVTRCLKSIYRKSVQARRDLKVQLRKADEDFLRKRNRAYQKTSDYKEVVNKNFTKVFTTIPLESGIGPLAIEKAQKDVFDHIFIRETCGKDIAAIASYVYYTWEVSPPFIHTRFLQGKDTLETTADCWISNIAKEREFIDCTYPLFDNTEEPPLAFDMMLKRIPHSKIPFDEDASGSDFAKQGLFLQILSSYHTWNTYKLDIKKLWQSMVLVDGDGCTSEVEEDDKEELTQVAICSPITTDLACPDSVANQPITDLACLDADTNLQSTATAASDLYYPQAVLDIASPGVDTDQCSMDCILDDEDLRLHRVEVASSLLDLACENLETHQKLMDSDLPKVRRQKGMIAQISAIFEGHEAIVKEVELYLQKLISDPLTSRQSMEALSTLVELSGLLIEKHQTAMEIRQSEIPRRISLYPNLEYLSYTQLEWERRYDDGPLEFLGGRTTSNYRRRNVVAWDLSTFTDVPLT